MDCLCRSVLMKPEKLIGDKAYDNDPLDEEQAEQGIEMIAPHKRNRVKPSTQDGRKLRRYQRCWLVERFLPGYNGKDASLFDGNITLPIS